MCVSKATLFSTAHYFSVFKFIGFRRNRFSQATVLHELQSLRKYLRPCDHFQNLTTFKADMLLHKNSRNLNLLVYQVET